MIQLINNDTQKHILIILKFTNARHASATNHDHNTAQYSTVQHPQKLCFLSFVLSLN